MEVPITEKLVQLFNKHLQRKSMDLFLYDSNFYHEKDIFLHNHQGKDPK